MDIKDIKIGMKVRLLGNHAYDEYDNIEDWFEDKKRWDDARQIKEQGYGYVIGIDEDDDILVGDRLDTNDGWCFLSSDLATYDEEAIKESTQIKTPKEWLLTPLSHFTVVTGDECITLGNGTSYVISNGNVWCDNLDEAYNKDLKYVSYDCEFNNVIKITYEGKVVWERKEEIKKMTLKEIEKGLGYKIEIVSE